MRVHREQAPPWPGPCGSSLWPPPALSAAGHSTCRQPVRTITPLYQSVGAGMDLLVACLHHNTELALSQLLSLLIGIHCAQARAGYERRD